MSPVPPMEVIRGMHNLRERHRGSVVTIGNYDGVHRGHQHMIAALRAKATELGLPAVIVTLDSPARVLRGAVGAVPADSAAREARGARPVRGGSVVALRFDRRMQGMGAADFVERYDDRGSLHQPVGGFA